MPKNYRPVSTCVKVMQNKKLSYRRETARQLPTWRGLGPPAHSPSEVRGTGPVKQVICPVSDLSRRSAGRGDLFVSRANTSIGQRFSPLGLLSSGTHFHLTSAHCTTVAGSSDRSWKLTFSDKPITLHDSSENNFVEEWNSVTVMRHDSASSHHGINSVTENDKLLWR